MRILHETVTLDLLHHTEALETILQPMITDLEQGHPRLDSKEKEKHHHMGVEHVLRQ